MGLGRTKKMAFCALAASVLLGTAVSVQAAATTVLTSRAFHVGERTRVVLETSQPVNYQIFALKSPDRLVLDMQDVDLDDKVKAISSKIRPDDPFIKSVRSGYFKPKVLRVVFDLKGAVTHSMFTLVPVGEYQDRLVLDIFPANATSTALLQKPMAQPAVAPLPATPVAEAAAVPEQNEQVVKKVIPEPVVHVLPAQEMVIPPLPTEPAPVDAAPVEAAQGLPADQPADMPADETEQLPAGTIIKTPVSDSDGSMSAAAAVAPIAGSDRSESFAGAGLIMKILIACGLLLMFI